jgi:hypothetical protein
MKINLVFDAKYFLLIDDDFSRKFWVFFFISKSQMYLVSFRISEVGVEKYMIRVLISFVLIMEMNYVLMNLLIFVRSD